ncbi:hypothetical protein TNCV_2748521 [Trichonephila clavipes]|nr:hypothetical protein TNCV_2748521 [Trichonephila clavipes]
MLRKKNWASIEKEAWAVSYGLNKFDKWIYGAKVEIISDHNPLKYLNQTTPKKSQANPLGTGVTEMESPHYSQASLSFEHHAGDNTILLGSTQILRKNTLGWSRASHLSSPSTNHTRGLAARWLFSVPLCLEDTIHLQTSIPSPGFEPRPYSIAASVTNHCTALAGSIPETNEDLSYRD